EERPHGHLRTGELLVDERLDAGPLPAGGFGGGLGYVPARVDLGAVLVLEPATYRLEIVRVDSALHHDLHPLIEAAAGALLQVGDSGVHDVAHVPDGLLVSHEVLPGVRDPFAS